MQWPGWVVGILIGIVLMFLANLVLGQAPNTVAKLVADADLVRKAVGLVGVAVGLGTLSFKAASTPGGLAALDTNTVAGPGTLAVASALLAL